MRDYSTARSSFWTGETGRRIRGNADAQRMAFYLFTCPASNMIGLYYLPIPTICHELGITKKAAMAALDCLAKLDFCRYDEPSEWVWVCQMAHYQLGARVEARDNRHKGIVRMLSDARKSPFAKDFHDKYRDSFCLPDMGLTRGLEGAPKGLGSPTVLVPVLDPVPVPVLDPDPVLDLSSKAGEFFEVWNRTPGVVPMSVLTPQRRKAIAARLADPQWRWRDALARFPLKCFDEPDGWKPNIEFFLRPNSVAKILEGFYDWSKAARAPNVDPRGNLAVMNRMLQELEHE